MTATPPAAYRSARNDLLDLDGSDQWRAAVDAALAKHRAEVLFAAADDLRAQHPTGDHARGPMEAAYLRGLLSAVRRLRRRAATADIPATPATPSTES